jgi:ParB/RepB/Spo0J family partition protein
MPAQQYLRIPVADITQSKTNPSNRTKGPDFDDLVTSVRNNGVLMPILVRPDGELYEVVAGHRRLAAARVAGQFDIPSVVREMGESEALEFQLIENNHRADLHPLEEAEGYRRLMQLAKLDAAGVSEHIGRSVAYVYDRVKLLELIPEGREHFLAGRILAGHAIVLSRLKPADQKSALAQGTFTRQEVMWDEADPTTKDSTKAVSVRELQAWVDQHVGFDASRVDPMLYPQTALALEQAEDTGRKVVAVTFGHYTPPSAKDSMGNDRIYHSASWKRADGQEKSKTCDYSVLGYVRAGLHRGESFLVCVDKNKCSTHWASEIRARKSRVATAARGSSGGGGATPREAPKSDPKLEQALRDAQDKANEAIEGAIYAKVGQLSPEKCLRVLLLGGRSWALREFAKQRKLTIPETDKGRRDWVAKVSIKSVQEALAYGLTADGDGDDLADALGIDAKAIYKQHEDHARAALKGESPQSKPAPKKAAKKAASKKRSR